MATNPDGTRIETPVNTARPAGKVALWFRNFMLGGTVLAIVLALGAATLARFDVLDKLTGFKTFMAMLMPLGALAVLALLGIIVGLVRKRGPGWKLPVALAASLVMVGVMYFQVIAPARAAPPLHDITTDVADPPQFVSLPLRPDNLIPFDNIEEWRAAHRQGYPDLGPVIINKAPAAVLAEARALAESNGWDVVSVDEAAGHMEAVAYAGYIRFMDDVIVEVTPIADGSTRVDMRSTSRVGLSDLGYNAKRIRDFLSELQAA